MLTRMKEVRGIKLEVDRVDKVDSVDKGFRY
jgi:hypothetical protein